METRLLRLLALFLIFFSPLANAIQTSDKDYYRVIMLSGEDIPKMLNQPIDSLSVFAVVDGLLEPIPFQIDEYNIGGAVYFENWDEPIDGTRHIMDPNDKLLFLLGDSGQRKEPYMKADGEILAEIELTSPEGTKRYAYLVQGSRLQSDAQHVRYSTEEGAVETDFFSLTFDKANHLIWQDFSYADYRGDSPIDGLKISFTSGVLTAGNQFTYSNESFVAKTVGENVGPIRTSIQLHFTFIFLGFEFIDASIQAHFYPNAFLYDVRFVMPEFRRSLAIDPYMTVGIDFNELIGAEAVTDLLPEPVIVDGEMSEEENKANGLVLTPDANGLLLRSNRGFDLLSYLDWGISEPLPTQIFYNDNTDYMSDADRFKGQLPISGYRVSDFPEKGVFGLITSVYLADYFKGKPRDLSKYVRTSPSIKINQ